MPGGVKRIVFLMETSALHHWRQLQGFAAVILFSVAVVAAVLLAGSNQPVGGGGAVLEVEHPPTPTSFDFQQGEE